MFKYFKELLATLKQIESHLKIIASCVQNNNRSHGVNSYISTGHWNDNNRY